MSELETKPGIPVAFTNTVNISWAGEHRFDAARPGSPPMRIDASGKTGSSPVDTLIAALGCCTAVDVVDILAKRRTPADSVNIEVVAARADATPKRVVGILLNYTIVGAGVERVHAERAIELAVTKYCSVRDSLDPDMPVNWHLTLNGE
jgi:putative redox protein